MANLDYFNSQLMVHFTMSELYQLSSALATESFSESNAGRRINADMAWDLRKKVKVFIDLYKNSLV